jgi:glycosyltransferase involved in cell wall biosynthesis
MTPAVSVVVATYNYARFLPSALESIRRQTWIDYEVIVVDDGSTDDTPDVVRPFLRDARFSYERTPHQKQPRAKNTGIRLARAPWIAFLDGDDYWLPAKLERQLALSRAAPRAGVIYARRRLMDEEGWELEYPQPPLYRGDVLARMFRANFVCFSSAMVRRDIFERVGTFDESLELAIDYDLWLRVARQFPFDYVDEPLVVYRAGHANLSRRHSERLQTAMRIMQRFLVEQGGRSLLTRSLVRRTWAETYCNMARAETSGCRGLAWFARALLQRPHHAEAWHGLAKLLIPPAAQPGLRRLLGGPIRTRWRRLAHAPAHPRIPACS